MKFLDKYIELMLAVLLTMGVIASGFLMYALITGNIK